MNKLKSTSIVISVIFLCGCAQLSGRSQHLRGPKTSLPDYAEQGKAAERATLETTILDAYRQRAGLDQLPGAGDPDWLLVVRAGVNAIDEECEMYVDAIFWANRELRTARDQLNLVGATTTSVMGIFSASAAAVAATAAAFGFGTQAITNYANGLLYEVEPSGIRQVVERSQAAYRVGIEQRQELYQSRPAAVAAIQGYLSICLPASIETQINEAVSDSQFALTDEGDAQNPVPTLQRVAVREETASAATVQEIQTRLETVIKEAVAETPQVEDSDRPKGCRNDECLFPISQAKEIQRALCLEDIDANFGPKTEAAIEAFEASENKELVVNANGELESKEALALQLVGPCGEPFKNALERFRYGDKGTNYAEPSPGLVKGLANTLERAGASIPDPKPATFNKTLRDAITAVQKTNQQDETGEVTKQLKQFLDELPPP